MKEKGREIFVNDFRGRVLETLRAANKEHIEASLELASGNPALTMHSVSYCCYTVPKSCLFFCKPNGLQPTRFLFAWNSPGKKTGVGCLSLLQGTFSIQESTQVSTLQADSLLSEPPRKPRGGGGWSELGE